MPRFKLNVPITTETPFITVENKLKPGVHAFQLVVVDDEGHESEPARARVKVVAPPPVPVPGPG